jgi:hypothetical protein
MYDSTSLLLNTQQLIYRDCTVSPGIDPGYIRLPQSKIIMYSFIGILLSREKIVNF